MNFFQFKQQRLRELLAAPWGELRIPDLLEVISTARPHRVLEVGSYAGVSTEIWALHCERVVSIDPSPDHAVRRQLHAALGHYPHVTLFEGFSPAAIDAWTTEPFDLVYLDGDHSYETVRREIDAVRTLIRPRWLGGHDYAAPDDPVTHGVVLAVDEAFAGDRGIHKFSDGSWLVKLGE